MQGPNNELSQHIPIRYWSVCIAKWRWRHGIAENTVNVNARTHMHTMYINTLCHNTLCHSCICLSCHTCSVSILWLHCSGLCNCYIHWRQAGFSSIVKLLLLTPPPHSSYWGSVVDLEWDFPRVCEIPFPLQHGSWNLSWPPQLKPTSEFLCTHNRERNGI